MKNVNFFRKFQKKRDKKRLFLIIIVICLVAIGGVLFTKTKNFTNPDQLKTESLKIYRNFLDKLALRRKEKDRELLKQSKPKKKPEPKPVKQKEKPETEFVKQKEEPISEFVMQKEESKIEPVKQKEEQKTEFVKQKEKPEIELATQKEEPVHVAKEKQKEDHGKKVSQKEHYVNVDEPEKIIRKQNKKKQKKGAYYLEVFSSVVKSAVDSNYAKLKTLGYEPVIVNQPGKELMYNVYTDFFPNKSDAMKMSENLRKDGYKGTLIILDDTSYTIRIASCYYKSSINEIVRILQELGYNSRVLKERMDFRRFVLLIKEIGSEEEGRRIAKDLKQHGYPSTILKKNSSST